MHSHSLDRFYLFVKNNFNGLGFLPSATQYWRSKVLEVAKDFPEYTFAIADEEDYSDELKSLGLSESGEEVNVCILGEEGKKYAMEPEEFDSDVLREFVQAFKKGEVVLDLLFSVPQKYILSLLVNTVVLLLTSV